MGGSHVYVGVDVHKNFSFVCAMKENGEVILEKKVRTEDLEKLLEDIENKTIILEPTTTAINLARKLRKKNEVLLSHPYKTKLIAESKKKTDRVDARVLADLARANFLPTAYLPPDEISELFKQQMDRSLSENPFIDRGRNKRDRQGNKTEMYGE